MTYRIGFVGTGDPDGDGFAMGYRHAEGYRRLDNCRIDACADIVRDNAIAFAEEYDIPESRRFEDFEEMLRTVDLDVLSVCVPPAVHADVVTTAATVGTLDGIHCEKPMAHTWRGAREMVNVCNRKDVQLTINHQYLFGRPYLAAKQLLDENIIGELERIELRSETLYDNGTHMFALANYYAEESPVEWVLGGIDYSEENELFGAHNENHAITQWRYEDGTYGLASTGKGKQFVGPLVRLLGSDGVIEVSADAETTYRQDGHSWQTVDTGIDGRYWPEPSRLKRGAELATRKVSQRLADYIGEPSYTARGIEEMLSSLESGNRSRIDAERALAGDELIFATWESVRRRGRVDLPLDIDDNPLEAMVDSGVLEPKPSPDGQKVDSDTMISRPVKQIRSQFF